MYKFLFSSVEYLASEISSFIPNHSLIHLLTLIYSKLAERFGVIVLLLACRWEFLRHFKIAKQRIDSVEGYTFI